MAWYYARGEERIGPVEDAEFEQLVASDTITAQTLVWQEGMAEWQPHGALAGAPAGDSEMPASLFGEVSAQPCAECGRSFPNDTMVAYEEHWVCSDCKDVFFQRIREGGGLLTSFNYAGFWIRFVARVVDGFILGFVNILLSFAQATLTGGFNVEPTPQVGGADVAIMLVFWAISIAINLGYEVYFIGKHAATPGKMVFGLKVVMSDGGQVSFGRAAGRYFATVLSSLTLMIGYIIAAFDSEKRALHDHICDTRVIRG